MALLDVTHRGRALHRVPSEVDGEEWVYQIGIPLQLSPTECGIVLNIRRAHILTGDLEIGNDLVILDRLDTISTERIFPLNRSDRRPHPSTGRNTLFARYPLVGGSVPLGAKRPDGSIHPHAGTGFAVSQVIGFPVDSKVQWAGHLPEAEQYHALEVQQYAYDGRHFSVTHVDLLSDAELFPGWSLGAPGLCHAVPDGDDLLMGFSGNQEGGTLQAGTLRWRKNGEEWHPSAFVPITKEGRFSEATLVRDTDGALLFTARGAPPLEKKIQVWRTADGGACWEQVLDRPQLRAGTPVSINRCADGSLYIAGNPDRDTDSLGRTLPSIEMRETLLLWSLAPDRRSLLDPIVARDCPREFGPAPNGSIWRADHPVGLTVRLADGQWHHMLCYRVLDREECVGDAMLTPHTGTFVEEIQSDGEHAGIWQF
ncbi:MAG: sialidase family protein [Candidatus Latescibacterota bacterium]